MDGKIRVADSPNFNQSWLDQTNAPLCTNSERFIISSFVSQIPDPFFFFFFPPRALWHVRDLSVKFEILFYFILLSIPGLGPRAE